MNTKTLFSATIAVLVSVIHPARADKSIDELKKQVVANYAEIAGLSTADAASQAIELQKAIAAFTTAPSKQTQDKAKQAWLAARLPYLQSEVFRTSSAGAAALDAAPVEFLKSADAKAGGFPAIEFLLWGEDNSVDGPGARPFEDFIKENSADAPRRVEYLNASAELVVEELSALAADWKAGTADNARAKFVALPTQDALAIVLGNISKLAGQELAQNRVGAAYNSRDQKDETSNFSDQTHLDLAYDCAGIANLVAGAYVGLDKQVKVQGAGLLELASAADAASGEALKLAINRVMLAVTGLRPPFDRALMAPDDSPAREAIKEIIDALNELSATTADVAKTLGIELEQKQKALK